MSDSTDHTPPREGGTSRDGEADGFSEPPPGTSGGGSPDESYLSTLRHWGVRWREQALARLDETLSRKTGKKDPFYLDILILGWFASPVELGIYARALILARLYLVIPGGFRPVFRRLANERLAAGLDDRLLAFMTLTIRGLFFVHGCLAVLVMVNFPRVITMVFDLQQWAGESFAVFALVLPGLIFFSAVTALEPIFEARQQTEKLKQMTLVVSIANLTLNLNLIPFAGLAGAAMATAGSMFVHFWLFCRWLPPDLGGIRIFWPGAAAALYLTYVLLTVIDIGMIVTLMATPILFGGLLWLVGFFNPLYPQSSIEPMQRTPA